MTKKTISPEEAQLFRSAVGVVRKLKTDKVVLQPENRPKPIPKFQPPVVDDYIQHAQDLPIEKLSTEDTFQFSIDGVQKNVFKKLRQGYFGHDAELDLHGLNSHDAKQQLVHFLHDSIENGWRCVRIIHGKGYRSVDKQPVLKNNLNIWLRQHKHVLAFCSAPQKHGGAGALLVLLRVTEKYRLEDGQDL